MSQAEYDTKYFMVYNTPEELHIEVRSRLHPDQSYFSKFTFEELPNQIKTRFQNLSQLYIQVNRPDRSSFDQASSSIKFIMEEGQNREVSLLLKEKVQFQGNLHEKVELKEEQSVIRASLSQKIHPEEPQQQQLPEKVGIQVKELKINCEKKGSQPKVIFKNPNKAVLQLQKAYQKLRPQVKEEQKNEQIKGNADDKSDKNAKVASQDKNKEKEKQGASGEAAEKGKTLEQTLNVQLKPMNHHSLMKQPFWVQKFKSESEKMSPLKQLVNSETNFSAQAQIILNKANLKKMQFIEVFPNLILLNLSKNKIRIINGLNHCHFLRKLNLSYNRIEQIQNLSSCPYINELDLSQNKIKDLKAIFHISNLRFLTINNNLVEAISPEIIKLSLLSEFSINFNNLASISENILLLKHLKIFEVKENKCCYENGGSNQVRFVVDKLMDRGVRMTGYLAVVKEAEE